MSIVKEVLRHKYLDNLSETLGIASKATVSNFTARFEKSGLTIDETLAMEEQHLLSLIFPELKQYVSKTDKPHPDWNYVHTELSKKYDKATALGSVQEQYPEGYGYTSSRSTITAIRKASTPLCDRSLYRR